MDAKNIYLPEFPQNGDPYPYLSSRRWSCRSSCHVYTTATPRSPDSRSTSTADCSQCLMLPPDWSTEVDANTSHLFCESFIGYGPEIVLTSNSPFSSSGVYMVWRHDTLPTTLVASPTPTADACACHRQLYWLWDQVDWWPWATVPFRSPAVDSGTLCRTTSPLLPHCLFSETVLSHIYLNFPFLSTNLFSHTLYQVSTMI